MESSTRLSSCFLELLFVGHGWVISAHCWVLKNQPYAAGTKSLGGVGCSGPPFACPWVFSGVWVLVGLLFEICIVDASIFRSWLCNRGWLLKCANFVFLRVLHALPVIVGGVCVLS